MTSPGDPSTTPTPPPVAGWRPTGPTRWSRWLAGCAILVIVLVGLFVLGLVFLGGQIRGSVYSGTGGTGCSVSDSADTFTTTDTVHSVMILEREFQPGEEGQLQLVAPNGTMQTEDESTDTPVDCVYLDSGPGLPVGRYEIHFVVGRETLATGGFEITR